MKNPRKSLGSAGGNLLIFPMGQLNKITTLVDTFPSDQIKEFTGASYPIIVQGSF